MYYLKLNFKINVRRGNLFGRKLFLVTYFGYEFGFRCVPNTQDLRADAEWCLLVSVSDAEERDKASVFDALGMKSDWCLC